jgi:hypothetical protein
VDGGYRLLSPGGQVGEATHRLADELWDQLPPVDEDELPPGRARTKPVPIRFDDSTLQRNRVIAARRNKGYQTLLKEFVVERLYEEERREGIVG